MDPTLQALATFDDPTKWVVVKNVPIFTTHVRERDGNELYEIDAPALEDIASATAKLEKTVAVCPPLQIGHTRNGPETEQAPIVGYARNLRVGTWGPEGKPGILADFYYRADDFEAAKKYPFRSVEYYPSRKCIGAVALLERAPELDMGMLLFSREPALYQSSQERIDMSTSNSSFQSSPGASRERHVELGSVSSEQMKEMYEHYQKHFAEHYHKHGSLPSPSLHPEHYADASSSSFHPLSQHAKVEAPKMPDQVPYAGGAAVASPTNAFVPDTQSSVSRMQREEKAIEYAQQEARVAALEKELEVERYARRTARVEQVVTQLQGEGYQIRDRAKLVARLSTMDDATLADAVAEIRENYTRVALGDRFIRTADVQAPQTSREQHFAAVSLATRESISYDEALLKVKGTK